MKGKKMKTDVPQKSAVTKKELQRADAAIRHCTDGFGIWKWASPDKGGEPDVVLACEKDRPILETLVAVGLPRKQAFCNKRIDHKTYIAR